MESLKQIYYRYKEKAKYSFWKNFIILCVWAVICAIMINIDKQDWFFDSKIIVLMLVSYWLNNTLFKKK